MRKSKNCYFYHIFVSPVGRPWGIHAKYCMDKKRIWCLQIVSQHVTIYLQQLFELQVQKIVVFAFLFPLETHLQLSRNMLHGWKDNSMLAKPLAARTYLSSIVSELFDA